MEHFDFIVIGGGITGLALAWQGRRAGWRVVVVEKDTRLGGCIHTQPLGAAEHGFWAELGSHTAFNSYGHLLRLLEEAGTLRQAVKKNSALYQLVIDGQRKSLFAQLHWAELLFSLPKLWRATKSGQSVQTYYSQIFGARNYQQVFAHAFNAVICQPANDFPAELLFRKKSRRKDVPRAFTFANGLSEAVTALAQYGGAPAGDIRLQQPATAVQYADGQFTVTLADGNALRAPRLALATPVDEAARLLHSAFPALAGLLSEIPMAEVHSRAVAVDKTQVTLPMLGGLIGVDDSPMYAAVSRDALAHARYRAFTFHFKPSATTAQQDACIRQALGVPNWLDESSKINRLPALRVGHERWLAQVDERLHGLPLALAGNYFLGVSLEDCLSRAHSEFSRLQTP